MQLSSSAAKHIRKLDGPLRRRLLLAIAQLEVDPRPAGVRKLSGESNAWRIRIGDYRVIYEIHDQQLLVLVFRAAHRREVY
ncbi:type II toxin-antitoxin system RelE/ParE family toxin [Paenarthrobacter sp. NPDC058040]|uniref:type II toxin-antitoxin system RelE family toxin n=1 Tax=unclassified Paenarthrobacter TaxID=2634190 RepID=UPI0036DEC6BB